jgi:hypothetical protein
MNIVVFCLYLLVFGFVFGFVLQSMSINVYVVYVVRVCVCKLLGAVLLRTHIAEQRVLLLYYIDLLTTMVYVCFLSIKISSNLCRFGGRAGVESHHVSNNHPPARYITEWDQESQVCQTIHPLRIQRNMIKRRRWLVVDDEDGFYK